MSNSSLHKPFITVSIVTWNHETDITNCIESILRQTYQEIEILILDNNSSDGTGSIIEKFANEYPQKIKAIFNKENRGFCGGHNTLINLAKGDFILLANPDVVFDPDFIENALKLFKKDSKVGTVCGISYSRKENGKPKIIDSAGLALTRLRKFKLIGHGQTVEHLPNQNFEVFGTDGAAPIYRKTMIDDISIGNQFFDEAFFAHKEDHDITWRARLFGWKTVCAVNAVAIHPRNFKPNNLRVRKKISSVTKFHAVKNQFLLILKNEDPNNLIRDFPLIVGYQLFIFIYILILEPSSLRAYFYVIKNIKSILSKRKMVQNYKRANWREIRSWINQETKTYPF